MYECNLYLYIFWALSFPLFPQFLSSFRLEKTTSFRFPIPNICIFYNISFPNFRKNIHTSMSSQSSPRLFLMCILLGIAIFSISTIGIEIAEVDLVNKGTNNVNLVDIEAPQGSLSPFNSPRKAPCTECFCWNWCDNPICEFNCYLWGAGHSVQSPDAVNKFDEELANQLRQIKALDISDAEKRAKSFGVFDANKNGMISEAELKAAKFSWDVSACVHGNDGVDADADGCLTSAEMQSDAMKNGQIEGGGAGGDNKNDGHSSASKTAADTAMVFKAMDTDKDGCLSLAERKAFCIEMSAPMNDALFGAGAFQLMDLNGDGHLSKAEFMQLDWQKVQDELFPVKGKKKSKQQKSDF